MVIVLTGSPSTLVVVDVNNLKNDRKPVKLQKESPAGCAGEGKQSKGYIGEENRTLYPDNCIFS